MGKQEDIVINFLSRNDRFADLFNGICFEGEQVIEPQALRPWNETVRAMVMDKERHNIIRRERDISRVVRLDGTEVLLMICCVEHQEHINYCMPFRSLMYDCLEYSDQVSRIQKQHSEKQDLQGDEYLGRFAKLDKLIPVVTLVFYTGTDTWDAGSSLWDMLDMKELDYRLSPYIGNWPLNLVEFQNIKNTEKYHSDLKLVMDVLQHRKNTEDLRNFINENTQYHNLDIDTFMRISKFMNIEEMMNEETENFINDEGGIDMCEAVRGIYEEGREEGREEGLRLAKRIFEKKLAGLSAEEIAKEENIDIEIVQKVLA